jgi:hypothetical protein
MASLIFLNDIMLLSAHSISQFFFNKFDIGFVIFCKVWVEPSIKIDLVEECLNLLLNFW